MEELGPGKKCHPFIQYQPGNMRDNIHLVHAGNCGTLLSSHACYSFSSSKGKLVFTSAKMCTVKRPGDSVLSAIHYVRPYNWFQDVSSLVWVNSVISFQQGTAYEPVQSFYDRRPRIECLHVWVRKCHFSPG